MKNLMILIFMIIMLNSIDGFSKETRIPIVVIDSGISAFQAKKPYVCKDGVLSTLGNSGIDEHGHGTNIIGIIASKMSKKYCIISIKVYGKKETSINSYFQGLRKAVNLNPSIINISMDGTESDFMESTYIQRALMYGIKIVVAAGNNSKNLDITCKAFPSCVKKEIHSSYHKNMFIVGATDTKTSNYGSIVTHKLPGKDLGFPRMSGTSQAAASLTSKLVQK